MQDRLMIEQVTLLCRLAIGPLVGTIVMGGLLCWILIESSSSGIVWAWYAAVVGMSAVRAALGRLFLARKRSVANATLTRRAMLVSAAASGGIWGIALIALVPPEPMHQVLATLFFVGALASGLATLSSVRFGYASMLVPFLAPFIVQQFAAGGDHTIVGLGATLFMLMMLYIARTNRLRMEETVRLRLDNEALATRLANDKDLLQSANTELMREVAERKRAESLLLQAKSEAEAANRAKSQFLANISHEVRTPMNAMIGMTELLTRTQLDAKQRRFAQLALESGQRLLHLINDILDLSRIEAGKLKLAQLEFAPRELVQEVIDLMSAQNTDKDLQLSCVIDDAVPEGLRGDADRLRQVLVNLLSNAIKFTARGLVKVTVALVPDDATRGRVGDSVRVRCTVEDTGIGVAPEARSRLFQPFSQGDDSTTRRFGGSGLGLAICRQVVEAMSGRIGFASELGRGSSFWFEVLLERVQSMQRSEREALPAIGRVVGRVLVVEDNAVNRTLLTEMLTMLGIAVSAVENGVQALALIERQSFDLVLMDWHMPQMDGVEATRRIRSRETALRITHPVCVVALTASAMPGDRDHCLEAGMDDYIAKPFTFDEVVAVLTRHLPSPGLKAVG
jgi:signal transduction histidine kinase/ActR/RegA family two-component response regulator